MCFHYFLIISNSKPERETEREKKFIFPFFLAGKKIWKENNQDYNKLSQMKEVSYWKKLHQHQHNERWLLVRAQALVPGTGGLPASIGTIFVKGHHASERHSPATPLRIEGEEIQRRRTTGVLFLLHFPSSIHFIASSPL